MERVRKQQLLEQSIYGVIWSVIFFLPLIGEYFAVSGGLEKEEVRTLVRDSWLGILTFFMLFLLNNYVLVPYFLFKKKILAIYTFFSFCNRCYFFDCSVSDERAFPERIQTGACVSFSKGKPTESDY